MPALRKTISLWFDVPELYPRNRTSKLEHYTSGTKYKNKVDILQRIKAVDWTEGLYAVQIAQLEIHTMMSRSSGRKWKFIEIAKESGKINTQMDMNTIQQQLDNFLSSLQDCYIYACKDKNQDTYWFYLRFYQSMDNEPISTKRQHGFIVYYPETGYLLVHPGWTKELNTYVMEAILNVFSADKLIIQTVAAAEIEEIAKQIMNRKSLGVFSQLRNNQTDANPLDIRQKRPRGFEDTYTRPGEQRRRIVPVDIEEMKARYEAINNHFGSDTILALPLQVSDSFETIETEDAEDEEDEEENMINIDINLKGSSVVDGLRQMVLAGTIQSPLPPWLENVAASVSSKIYISKDGVLKERYENDSDNENYGVEDILAEEKEHEKARRGIGELIAEIEREQQDTPL
ncbi:hypothetical protein RMATCC62417_01438 [Rhizopus microsporus]|nr:hypothetical protein RMATCC62417_01438 [Rhizopus microsporus]